MIRVDFGRLWEYDWHPLPLGLFRLPRRWLEEEMVAVVVGFSSSEVELGHSDRFATPRPTCHDETDRFPLA
jgi:hypothetical protein